MSVALLSQAKKSDRGTTQQNILICLHFPDCFHFLPYQKFMSVALLSKANKSECGTTQQSLKI